MLGGWERVTAGYLIEGPAPVLIETGSQTSVPVLLAALDQIGVGPSELAGVAVTHIHLDHAGGVGDVARAFPSAKVYVHEKGARHLADPARLIDSAARVYGPLLDSLYGRLDPTPPERLHVLEDGEEIEIGPGRSLTAVDSPGHAKHHVGLHDSLSGVLFAGDAVGVKLPDGGVLRPSTPPPDFDLDQALTSLAKFAARRPSGIALAHYGLLEQPEELLAEADETLRLWAETAEKAYREGTDIADALSDRFDPLLGDIDAAHKEKLDIMNGVHSNAAGFRRWLEGRDAGDHRPERTCPGEHPSAPPISGLQRAEQRTGSDDEFGAELLLADFEVVEGDTALGQVLVQCGELLEQARLVHLVGREGRGGLLIRHRLVLLPRNAVVHLRLGPVLLGLVALQFPKCRTCACHGSLLSGRRAAARCCRQGACPADVLAAPACAVGLFGPERRRWDLNPRYP